MLIVFLVLCAPKLSTTTNNKLITVLRLLFLFFCAKHDAVQA